MDRPILFSAPMVRAILAGTKTQTRRVVKPAGWNPASTEYAGLTALKAHADQRIGLQAYFWHPASATSHGVRCPYGKPGDRLWVRETWGFNPDFPGMAGHACYRADKGHEYDGIKWRPSIHMPRAASRITLEVTGVRVERLQEISEADALAEGIVPGYGGYALADGSHFHAADPRQSYLSLWEAINGRASVEANPWVWVLEFRRAPSANERKE